MHDQFTRLVEARRDEMMQQRQITENQNHWKATHFNERLYLINLVSSIYELMDFFFLPFSYKKPLHPHSHVYSVCVDIRTTLHH